ncbi:hypothetical protein PENSPDRAFT_212190 [Peniophora sp. CONT]|nr:hypothetical protein PENSPDRAFT_212190 [Peniophora sp. CONT]
MSYFRVFALTSIDVILTLPFGIVNTVFVVTGSLSVLGHLPIYSGWDSLHTDWHPVGISYTEQLENGISNIAQTYAIHWSSPILAFAIFGLFGVTAEARASYWRIICTVGSLFGWKPTLRSSSSMGTMEFGEQPQDMSFNFDIESQPNYVDTDARAERGAENEGGRAPTCALESTDITDKPSGIIDDTVCVHSQP